MRRHRFVKGKGCRVARSRQNRKSKGAYGSTQLGDIVGRREEFHENIDDTRGAQSGCENPRSNDDAQNLRVAASHTVEEFLRRLLRRRSRHRYGVDHSEKHGGCHAHFELRRTDGYRHQDDDRNQGSQGVKNIGVFRQI